MNGNLSCRVARLESEAPCSKGMLYIYEGPEGADIADLGIKTDPKDLVVHLKLFDEGTKSRLISSTPLRDQV